MSERASARSTSPNRPTHRSYEIRQCRLIGHENHFAAAEQVDLVQDLAQDLDSVASRGETPPLGRHPGSPLLRFRGGSPGLCWCLGGAGAPRDPEENLVAM